MCFTTKGKIVCSILFVIVVPLVLFGGESLTTWGYLYLGNSVADTTNGLFLRNYIVIRSDEVQYLNQANVYFVDINDTTKIWLSNAGNFSTPESKGDPDIAVIDWQANSGTVKHKGYYAIINDTIWDPAVHSVQQFSDCVLRSIPVPDTITTVGQIELIWNTPVEDPGVPDTANIIGYNVYRGHNGIDFPVRLNSGIVTDTFYTDNISVGDSVYYYAIKLVYRGIPDTIQSRCFSANSPMIKANHDVGVDSIISPGDTIFPSVPINPAARVRNYGTTTESFPVICQIDSSGVNVYYDSCFVDTLKPDSSRIASFAIWVPGTNSGIVYDIMFVTQLTEDVNPGNDTLRRTISTGVEESQAEGQRIPRTFVFYQNMPNPFTRKTEIRFQIPDIREEIDTYSLTPTTLKIYNISGRIVRNFAISNPSVPSSGSRDFQFPVSKVSWDGRDNQGKKVSAGTYFVKFKAGNYISWKKITLIR